MYNSYPKGVSIIVCCYNSASRLPETLQHIARQQVNQVIPWEVIVVNNASTDTTREAAQITWDQQNCSVPFSIVDELQPGLSHARHRGFETAQYEYVLFCDDDNWLSEDYVQRAFYIMEGNNEIGVLGGRGEAVLEAPAPSWFPYYGFHVYAIDKQAEQSGEVPRGMVYGAGSVYRKSIYNYLVTSGFESMLTDRKGKELSSGGDDELCFVTTLLGYKIWYEDSLVFKHFIPKERLTWNYVERFLISSAQTATVLMPFEEVLKGRITSLQQFRPYTSIERFLSFLAFRATGYWLRRFKGVFIKSIQLNQWEKIVFYREWLRAKKLLNAKEYDHNLKRILALKERF